MWHASAASRVLNFELLHLMVQKMLRRVGDAKLGEWVARSTTGDGLRVVHLRRRLTAAEAKKVGPVRDIRGTPERDRRLAATVRRSGIPRHMLEGIPE